MYRVFASSFQTSSSDKNQIKKNSIFFFMKLLVACQIFPILITYVGYSNIFRKWAKSMHYIEEGNAKVHN